MTLINGDPAQMTILLVDDAPANIDVLSNTLRPNGYEIAIANSGDKALRIAEKIHPDLILLDVTMPRLDGFETCRILKKNPVTQNIPVIFITARTEAQDIDEGFSAGAVDYISKPFRDAEVQARVKTHLTMKYTRDRLIALNEQKDKFLGMAAHDLRSPLAGVRGYVEIIRDYGDDMDPAERNEMFGAMVEACDGILYLVNDLLDVTAIASGKVSMEKDRCDLAELLEARCNFARFAAARKEIRLDVELPRALPGVFDPRRLGQVVDNLVSNAIKFSPPCSVVRVSGWKLDRGLEAAVQDQGPGLREEDFQSLFQDFQKLSATPTAGEASTGLGLAISRRIIEAHGGSIYGRNGAEKGAIFGFVLPGA